MKSIIKLPDLYEKKGFTSKGIHEYIVIAEMFMQDENYEAFCWRHIEKHWNWDQK